MIAEKMSDHIISDTIWINLSIFLTLYKFYTIIQEDRNLLISIYNYWVLSILAI